MLYLKFYTVKYRYSRLLPKYNKLDISILLPLSRHAIHHNYNTTCGNVHTASSKPLIA